MSEKVRKSVLVVDDTPTNIDILLEILTEEYDVAVALDGESALESVDESKPDIILLDIMMPGMDGYEVCTTLKKHESTRDIPVVFITAMNDIKDEIKGFEVGAVDYITKPFSLPVVQRRVEAILKLEEKTRDLTVLSNKLSKYLSPQVYVSIFRGEQDVVIESKRKKLTIFFSDIVNFTSTTEGMEAEDLSALLNSYLEEMSSIALKHGGTIDKFIGDAMLIFFGDPLTRGLEEDAQACVSMAIEMRDRLKELQKRWYSFGMQEPFKVRTGIATGYCTVGNFGSKNRMDYTIIGNQVNIAARLEGKAQPGQILISHETWSLVSDHIRCIKDGLIHVKGISHPIQTYQVIDLAEKVDEALPQLLAGQFLEPIEQIEITKTLGDAYIMLDKKSPLEPLVIVKEGNPQGIINRYQLMEQLQGDLSKAVYLEQELISLLIKEVVTVDIEWPLREILSRVSLRKESDLFDPVLVTEEGKLVGMIPAHKLVKHILEK